MKKSKGFTLAEILIAMTVLGIIVAASVPVILNMRPDKNAIMMKKAYYATETIINGLINDSYYYPETDDPATEGFLNSNHVTVEGINIDNTTVKLENKLPCLFASKLNIKEDLETICKTNTATASIIVTTMDGMTWDLTGLVNGSGYIRIDMDGPDKGKNIFFVEATDSKDLKDEPNPSGSCTNPDLMHYKWDNCTAYAKGKKAAKVFDRMLIKVSSNGRLNVICSEQTELCDIISGERSMFKDDEN